MFAPVNMNITNNKWSFMGYLEKQTITKKWKLRYVTLNLSQNTIKTWNNHQIQSKLIKNLFQINHCCTVNQIHLKSPHNYFGFKITTKYKQKEQNHHCQLPGHSQINFFNYQQNKKLDTTLTFRCNSKQSLQTWLQLIEDCILRSKYDNILFTKRITKTDIDTVHQRLVNHYNDNVYHQMLQVYETLINFEHNQNNKHMCNKYYYEFMAYCYG
eukprot:193295_1